MEYAFIYFLWMFFNYFFKKIFLLWVHGSNGERVFMGVNKRVILSWVVALALYYRHLRKRCITLLYYLCFFLYFHFHFHFRIKCSVLSWIHFIADRIVSEQFCSSIIESSLMEILCKEILFTQWTLVRICLIFFSLLIVYFCLFLFLILK